MNTIDDNNRRCWEGDNTYHPEILGGGSHTQIKYPTMLRKFSYLGLSDSTCYVPKDKKAVLPSNAKVVGLKVKLSPIRGIV